MAGKTKTQEPREEDVAEQEGPAEEQAMEEQAQASVEPSDEGVAGEQEPAAEHGPARKWYVVHTYSGQEGKVKAYLEKASATDGPGHLIGRVLVPTEEVTEVRRGKRATVTRKFYPSYVIVEMLMNDETWQLVSDAPGVTGFIGDRRRPQPLRESEAERVLSQMEHKRGRPSHEVPFQVGDSVTVVDGPFADFSGVVDEINPERGRLKVMVSILGRPTPVELDILQVRAL